MNHLKKTQKSVLNTDMNPCKDSTYHMILIIESVKKSQKNSHKQMSYCSESGLLYKWVRKTINLEHELYWFELDQRSKKRTKHNFLVLLI